jgi:hypothetical protein
MESFSTETFVAVLSLIGMVLLLGALLSGLIERSGVPQVAVFLGLGAVLGPAGMGMLDITLQSPVLRVVATLSLVLVLFTDAITLNLQEIRRYNTLTLLVCWALRPQVRRSWVRRSRLLIRCCCVACCGGAIFPQKHAWHCA